MTLVKKGNNPYPMPPKVRKTLKAASTPTPKSSRFWSKRPPAPTTIRNWTTRFLPEIYREMLPVVQKFARTRVCCNTGFGCLWPRGITTKPCEPPWSFFGWPAIANAIPTLVGCLVAITIRGIAVDSANLVLQAGPVSKEVRDALDTELALQERMEGYTRATQERAGLPLASCDVFLSRVLRARPLETAG